MQRKIKMRRAKVSRTPSVCADAVNPIHSSPALIILTSASSCIFSSCCWWSYSGCASIMAAMVLFSKGGLLLSLDDSIEYIVRVADHECAVQKL